MARGRMTTRQMLDRIRADRARGVDKAGTLAGRLPTDRQRILLEFLRAYILENGHPPTLREMGEQIGALSGQSIHHHLKRLVRLGLVRSSGYYRRRCWMPVSQPGCCPACNQPLPRAPGGDHGEPKPG